MPDDIIEINGDIGPAPKDGKVWNLQEEGNTSTGRKTYALQWNPREGDCGNLFFNLCYEIFHKYRGSKSAKQFMCLFDSDAEKVLLRICYCHLAPIGTLCYLFYRCGRITCFGNHGIYEFIAQHTMNPKNGKFYTSGQIRSHIDRIKSCPVQFEHLKESIRKLFFSVCKLESDKKVFEDFFS